MDNSKLKVKSKKLKVEDKVHEELETVKGMLARALADYDNLSKRVDRERQDLGKIASVGIIVRLIPVLDNLESAQTHLQDQGLAISIIEFKKVLSEEGLTEISPKVGEQFDENLMEAIEVVTGASDNSVAEVVLTGWKFSDPTSPPGLRGASVTVVRHAKVKVSKASS